MTSFSSALRTSQNCHINAALSQFSAISLEETNQSAQMLNRIDNKYIVDKRALLSLLDQMKSRFRILSIAERRIFSYRSCYFDDDARCFREHQQGRRKRFKVRTRLYVESNKAYFEVKIKGKRSQTQKSRTVCERFSDFTIDEAQNEMLRSLYETSYGKEFRYDMKPALHVCYQRFTLVSSTGGERTTIDFNLGFASPNGKRVQIGDDFIIIETKSSNGRGIADSLMKRNHIRTASGCSKYCVGMVLTGEVQRFNKFRPIVNVVRSRMAGQQSSEVGRYNSKTFVSPDHVGAVG